MCSSFRALLMLFREHAPRSENEEQSFIGGFYVSRLLLLLLGLSRRTREWKKTNSQSLLFSDDGKNTKDVEM
jgi:hypothetical protein